MQHHGLPTRLFDWIESALVALYFALRDAKGENNPAVWVLDPFALNRKIARKRSQIFLPTDKIVQGYLGDPFSEKPPRPLPRGPIALNAPFHSRRIAAQRGVFTLHGQSRKALERYTVLKPHLIKIEIMRNKISIIREQILVAGITETTVFPELPSLCQELLDYWKYLPPSKKDIQLSKTKGKG
jgi:hypothetical protein